jgi:hypothetical protein
MFFNDAEDNVAEYNPAYGGNSMMMGGGGGTGFE